MAWAIAAVVTILLVLFLLDRRTAALVLALALAVGGAVWAFTGSQWFWRSEPAGSVTASATVGADGCEDAQQPIRVEFHNSSERQVERVSFELAARHKDHSSVVYRAFLRSDRILQPGEVAVACYGILPHGFLPPRPLNPDLATYQWSIEISLVDFVS
ncbi:hypothetical protein [Rhizobium halophilum]|uniref:hypothetical protein n=1 Tax=Rhizobium halophilum TaxID=2846852 RepID=UPI001EFCCDBB|nr:hypothetical protein [Rhizobium halophilum]MCF6370118.1 hypothetical protein [Rhizobium halophilum]